jgi:hypothetical protein
VRRPGTSAGRGALCASHAGDSNAASYGVYVSILEALLLHLLVSLCIGMTYGLLFRNEGSSLIMASAWGWFFGLIWWYTGPLTLLPLLHSGEVDWRLSAASRLFPSLFAHLAYGVGDWLCVLSAGAALCRSSQAKPAHGSRGTPSATSGNARSSSLAVCIWLVRGNSDPARMRVSWLKPLRERI